MDRIISNIQDSLYTAFIDQMHYSKNDIRPRLIINRPKDREDLSNYLLKELSSCESFTFAVAFITESGLAILKSKLLDLQKRNIKGKILTSDFLKFNAPKVFEELLKIKNAEVRVYESKGFAGFHIKGYAFDQGHYQTLVIGSSNLTVQALKTNHEMNLMVTSLYNGEIIQNFYEEFNETWQKSLALTKTWINEYRTEYLCYQSPRDLQEINIKNHLSQQQIIPNLMQKNALENLKRLREQGAKKALLISATGTGKTFLAAFDVANFRPNRMLFIVHREQILQKAKEDFKKILGGEDGDFGLYTGQHQELNAKYLFATIQTIQRHFQTFEPDQFHYMIIDEVHKAGAESYQKVIDYFKPEFMLGMTATPERNDDFNLFKLFDHQIAYEIRLQEALEEDMLCPFHYYGVTEFQENGIMVDEISRLRLISNDDRIDYLLEKINYYGYAGSRVQGLIFCARNDEARDLSLKLNERGLKTIALSGENTQEERQFAIEKLEQGHLEYIITVDIFNEGIDIPSINQVIFLRQTQSSIIFIQQLGRGLRKHPSKSFVSIIDFIGNYDQNYLIPIALSSDSSRNKDILRKSIYAPYITGLSSIHFEEIAKQKIFQALSKVKLNHISALEKAYQDLRARLNRLILPSDFIKQNSIDPEVIIQRISYPDFLLRVEDPKLNQNLQCSTYEKQVILWFEKEILNGKRKHEIILLELLCLSHKIDESTLIDRFISLKIPTDQSDLQSMMRILDLSFFINADFEKYGKKPIVYQVNQTYSLNESIIESLQKNELFAHLLCDVIQTALMKSEKYHHQPFTLYEKYTRKDVCRLYHWHKDESSTMYGYKTKHQTCPIFITYHKSEDLQGSIKYHDHFLSQNVLHWFTRSNRKLESPEVQTILNAREMGIVIRIFVKKDDDEGLDFYDLGEASIELKSVKQSQMQTGEAVVSMNLILNHAIPLHLYEYLIAT